jgi:hypothetical protein
MADWVTHRVVSLINSWPIVAYSAAAGKQEYTKMKIIITTFVLTLLCGGVCYSEDINPVESPEIISTQTNSEPTQPHATVTDDTPIRLAPPKGEWAGDASRFFRGALAAFTCHELGHCIANYSIGTDPFLKSVNYGPIPFFTIEPGEQLNNRRHYITASAGFNAQHIANEWILTKHPNLSAENEPYLKGIASFNFWLTVGYAASALTKTGPSERDTKGMADSLGWDERWVGAMLLVPTALDTYRYKHPDAKWAITASRLSKLAIIALAFEADD